jgi:hypothetical protein
MAQTSECRKLTIEHLALLIITLLTLYHHCVTAFLQHTLSFLGTSFNMGVTQMEI